MAIKISTQILDDLNDLLAEDTLNAAPWTALVKQRAVNRAIRGSYPHFKVEKKNETVTLAAGTYIYSLSAITDIEEHGINRVYVEPATSDAEWIPLRRVEQRLADGVWYLYVPDDIGDTYSGKKLRIHYYAAPAEITDWSGGTLEARFVNYVIFKALADLFQIAIAVGDDDKVDAHTLLIPQYAQAAADELRKNTVFEAPRLVGYLAGH